MEARLIIGILLNLEIWTFFIVSILCMYCIYKSHLYKNEDNPAYLITTYNLFFEILQLLVHAVYIGPLVLIGDWMTPGGQGSLIQTIVSVYFLFLWYLGSFIQILMAANRLCVVFFPGRTIMTHFRISLIVFLMILLTMGCTSYSQLLSPCCRITPDFHTYSYNYLNLANHTSNPSMMFVDWPVDFSTSIICAISYVSLFAYVYHMSSSDTGIRSRDIRLTIQFSIMFLCYTVAWLTFFFFPRLGIETPEFYVVTSSMLVANCGVNAVVYLTMNKEIKHELKKIFGKVAPVASYTSTSNQMKVRA